ncbi:MAG: hypothetical protein JWO91_3270 [Acidobacteriaceae bacterium]|nr:hypothetical protein [Acidobacteriaceae bacterium]
MSKVQVGRYHGRYFPRPGCVLEHVTFQHNPKPGAAPLITAQRITVQGSFFGLFARHVKGIQVEGMRILVPARGTGEYFKTPQRSTIVIDQLTADGAVLEIASKNPDKQPLKFNFHEFTLNDVGSIGPASFKAKFSNPEPRGEIRTNGKFGPWNADDVGRTPVSGEYLFEQANLGEFKAIAGTLSSSGKFIGTLDRIAVEGSTETPNFAVTSSSHRLALRTHFQSEVNAKNGDTFLRTVAAHFWRTTVWSEGSIARNGKQEGKMASLDIATRNGRIEDILGLFTSSPKAPMSGAVNFKAKVLIPPGQRSFLEKVELQGDFGVDDGKFTKLETQEGVNQLSEGARGEKDHDKNEPAQLNAETVLSNLKGHVILKDGTANFPNLSFSIPGASAQLHGTYNLISEKIDLHGTLNTDAELSKTTHGVKALMLKVLDPFFKKHRAGYAAPVKITGTYEHPSFGLDLADSESKHHGS